MKRKLDPELEKIFASMCETAEFDQRTLLDVNDRGNLGNTPLHVAAVWGDVQAINCLLDHGAEIDAVGELGETALHVAVHVHHADAVKTLLWRGASPSIKNESGQTAIDLARQFAPSMTRLFNPHLEEG